MEAIWVAKDLLCSLLYLRHDGETSSYLHQPQHLCLAKAILDRAYQIDQVLGGDQQHQPLRQGLLVSTSTSSTTGSTSLNEMDDHRVDLFHPNHHHHNLHGTNPNEIQQRFLLQATKQDGYTPLHAAIWKGDLPSILLLLRHVHVHVHEEQEGDERFLQRPMNILQTEIPTTTMGSGGGGGGGGKPQQLQSFSQTPIQSRDITRTKTSTMMMMMMKMTQIKDKEGLKPLELLFKRSIHELAMCRQSLIGTIFDTPRLSLGRRTSYRSSPRPYSLDNNNNDGRTVPTSRRLEQDENREQDELDILRQHMPLLLTAEGHYHHYHPPNDNDDDDYYYQYQYEYQQTTGIRPSTTTTTTTTTGITYGCEVMTFGRAHHSALGVIQSSSSSTPAANNKKKILYPQRVQEFAQETRGRMQSAIAIAAAKHHTLVLTRDGHVYSFGIGARLGLGEDHVPTFLPRRIMGSLKTRQVMAIAAAENHSLCVTRDGAVYAWGSNRFGQLGACAATNGGGNNNNNNNNTSNLDTTSATNSRSSPRRVDELKQVPCRAVAAGERHSVALSTHTGQVYAWGDNTSGQLGVARRTASHKPQPIQALSNKIIIAISAAEQSTLALAKSGDSNGLPVNSVYEWGHGNPVPIKVQFDRRVASSAANTSTAMRHGPLVNPVAIACAKYHNVAITSDGHVYTWGLHAEPLGRAQTTNQSSNRAHSTTMLPSPPATTTYSRSMSSPQLVTGMLPEFGGGLAVAVAASDEHTAVITNCGALYTWGVTHGKNVLGHEGVKWQPSPKRVPGVFRAVQVAVAKEHTVLLIGASFPPIPESLPNEIPTLELLAARTVAKHVDLFNVIPILIMAERTEVGPIQHLVKRQTPIKKRYSASRIFFIFSFLNPNQFVCSFSFSIFFPGEKVLLFERLL